MSLNSYQELNLNENARPEEIKAAFRRLAKCYHPDAAGQTQADVEKFIRAQAAYQKLMKTAMTHNRARRAAQAQPRTEAPRPESPRNWRFESRREVGLDIYLHIAMVRPQAGQSVKIVLPWQVKEACPRCLGQGQTLAKVSRNGIYRPELCPRCGGHGSVSRDSQLEVTITPAMVEQGKARLRRAGNYMPKEARRGDLFLMINFVDQLPAEH